MASLAWGAFLAVACSMSLAPQLSTKPRRLHQHHSPFALAQRKLDAGTLTYGEARDALFRAGRARKTSECAAFVRALCLKRPAKSGGGASFRVSEHLASFALNAYAREGDTAAARHLLKAASPMMLPQDRCLLDARRGKPVRVRTLGAWRGSLASSGIGRGRTLGRVVEERARGG